MIKIYMIFKYNKKKLIPKAEIVNYNLIMNFIKIAFGIKYATKGLYLKKEKIKSYIK